MSGDLSPFDHLIIELGEQYGKNKFQLDFDEIKNFMFKAYNLGKEERKK